MLRIRKVLQYIKGTNNFGIFFPKGGKKIAFYIDADWAKDLDKQKSTIGLIFKFHNCPVLWSNQLQLTIALSTTEVEYRALTNAT
jgi:hypothetical protein